MEKLLGNDAIAAAIKSGNINISTNATVEVMDLNAESRAAQLKHSETLQKYEAQKRARLIAVPTSIEEIKARLRDLKQPVTLFGEDHVDRRERLKEIIARLELGEEDLIKLKSFINQGAPQSTTEVKSQAGTNQSNEKLSKSSLKEIVYTKASEELVAIRKSIANYSFKTAHDRILSTKQMRENEELQSQNDKFAYDLYTYNSSLSLNCSQIGDDRPLTCVRFRPGGKVAASGSLGCGVKIWDLSADSSQFFSCLGVLRGHTERITSISWPKQESISTGSSSLLASSSSDGFCNIWKIKLDQRRDMEEEGKERVDDGLSSHKKVVSSTEAQERKKKLKDEEEENENESKNESDSEEGDDDEDNLSDMAVEEEEERLTKRPQDIKTTTSEEEKENDFYQLSLQLNGSGGVVGDCSFHPMGGLVGTVHQDFTWRLWDIETGSELLFQDGGHCRECCSIAFHPDGSLVMTGDAGGVLQLWDLRSGQNIHGFQGHMKKISSIDFSANGFQVVSSGVDNLARIWDLRKKKSSYVLPAHSLSISEVRYSESGELLLTSSFDGSLKVWGTRDYRLLKTLMGHTGKVMSADFSSDEKRIISAGFDRTLKYWTHSSEV